MRHRTVLHRTYRFLRFLAVKHLNNGGLQYGDANGLNSLEILYHQFSELDLYVYVNNLLLTIESSHINPNEKNVRKT